MANASDPYRTLGLPRDASVEEVKRAYRRLAKAHHPDAAGEGALPRFLAIQDAYDRIIGPDGGGVAGRGRRPTRRPSEADPERAEATRRAYGGRSRRARSSGAARPSTGTRPSGGSGQAHGRRPEPGPPPGARDGVPPKVATLGSTSYDDAESEPFEPDWGGASWYGTTSGTYWTLNPKEYADPRKHGPEYQARARRAAAATEAPPVVEGTVGVAAGPDAGRMEAEAPPGPATPPGPTHTTTSWWDATAATSGAAPEGGHEDRTGAPAATSDTTGLPFAWFDDVCPGLVARIGRAVVGWVPIALAIGAIAGEASGCSRFAAECDPSIASVATIAQVLALLVLILAPRMAAVAALAASVTLLAAIPVALVLAVGGGTGAGGAAAAVLVGILALAWLGGLAAGVVRAMRRSPRPVS